MKKTPWFPGTVKPVHVGVYERKFPQFGVGHWIRYSYWDGCHWCLSAENARDAYLMRRVPVEVIYPWRGLTEKP